jgi:hypothetical protein
MSTPTVGRFLPGYTGTRAAEPLRECIWSVDRDGRRVCTVRRDLKRAVEGWTGAARAVRDPSKRAVAEDRRKRALDALSQHHCDRVAVEEVRKGEDVPRSPDGGSWSARGSHPNAERSAPTLAVTRLDIDRHVLELTGAAVVYGMRKERLAHADAPADTPDKIAEAEQRMGDASDALHRAMDRYNPNGVPHEAI